MLKELDQQTMEETSGGTFCSWGSLLIGTAEILGDLGSMFGSCYTQPSMPTCPPAPVPSCPAPSVPTCAPAPRTPHHPRPNCGGSAQPSIPS